MTNEVQTRNEAVAKAKHTVDSRRSYLRFFAKDLTAVEKAEARKELEAAETELFLMGEGE